MKTLMIAFVVLLQTFCFGLVYVPAQMGGMGDGGGHLYPDLYEGDFYEQLNPNARDIAQIDRNDTDDYPTIVFYDHDDFTEAIGTEKAEWEAFFPLGVNLVYAEVEDGISYLEEKYVFEPNSNQFLFEDQATSFLYSMLHPTTVAYFGTFGEAEKPVKKVIGYIYVIWHDTNPNGPNGGGNGQVDSDEPVYVGMTTKENRLGGHASGEHGPFIFPPENQFPNLDTTDDIPVIIIAKPVYREPNGGGTYTDEQILKFHEMEALTQLPHVTWESPGNTRDGTPKPNEPTFPEDNGADDGSDGFTGLQNSDRPLNPTKFGEMGGAEGGSTSPDGTGSGTWTGPLLAGPGPFRNPKTYEPVFPSPGEELPEEPAGPVVDNPFGN